MLPLFFESNLPEKENIEFFFSEETCKHSVQVLRMQKGAHLMLTDGKGTIATASILGYNKKSCSAVLIEKYFINSEPKNISIAISLLKNTSRFEWFLEKATELGVNEFYPLLCQRTEKEKFRFERLNSILISAMLQSNQSWLPVLHQPKKYQDFIFQPINGIKLIAHCLDTSKLEMKKALTQYAFNSSNNTILIGPEGDFTEEEVNLATNNGFQPVTLGKTRLRTETAGIAAAVWLTSTR